jgi:hypothetical protein
MTAGKLKLRDLRRRCDVANALRAAECDASDTRSQSLLDRSATP